MKEQYSMQGLLDTVRESFVLIKEDVERKKNMPLMPLVDCLMSGLSLFNLKYSSLLKFDVDRKNIAYNMKHLYNIESLPSDTYMRERLDNVHPREIRKAFKKLFAKVQRGKQLEAYKFIDESYLLSIDGTGYFSSNEVHCDSCCIKRHRNGEVTYYHQILSGAIVHPEMKEVLPFAPEPIMRADGTNKNDCERNATRRFIKDFRQEHPHLKVIVVEDGLSSNAPHIEVLKTYNMKFILVAKETDHKHLFEEFNALSKNELTLKREEITHKFKWQNGLELNASNPGCIVNMLEYWEIKEKKTKHFAWITDIPLKRENVVNIMKGGRARWKIENETFNTLKNQGYHFEHNFGHGKRYLSTVFAHLMLLAFLIDQIQQLSCDTFKKALKRLKRKSNLWEKMRGIFSNIFVDSWDHLMRALANGLKAKLIFDTS